MVFYHPHAGVGLGAKRISVQAQEGECSDEGGSFVPIDKPIRLGNTKSIGHCKIKGIARAMYSEIAPAIVPP